LPTKWNAFIVSTVDSASSSTVSVVSLRQAHQPFRSSHFDKLTSTSSSTVSVVSLRQAHFDKLSEQSEDIEDIEDTELVEVTEMTRTKQQI